MKAIVKISDLVKYYYVGENVVKAVDHTNLEIERGKFTAIVGRSGSGKSTLLQIVGGLDRPDSGEVIIDGKNLFELTGNQLAVFRRKKIGFIFQDFNLIPSLNVWENVVLPMGLDGRKVKKDEVMNILKQIGLEDKTEAMPNTLSGGQKQRVAIARALVSSPAIILADEPTGALDSKATDELLRLFGEINQTGQTILMVTHSVKAASHASRVLFIKDGEVFHQIYRGDHTNEQMYQMISDTLTILATGGDRR